MAHHAFVGAGFLLGPFIVARYFPHVENNKEASREELCQKDHEKQSDVSQAVDIVTPFHEISYGIILTGVLFLMLICYPYEMPGNFIEIMIFVTYLVHE